jgi:sugar phosphate isomerase/epimerase
MKVAMSRRSFLGKAAGAVGALAVSAGVPGAAGAIEPFQRLPGRKFPLSCAAYSLRQHLDLRKPTMTLEDFIVKCAEWGTDGVELTEYYFPKPLSRPYVSRLKRHAVLWGQEITGTPVGNNFALPPGPDRDRQVDAVKSWIDVSADLGSPAIRIFAGGAPKGVEDALARKWVVECIEACCETATKRGVFLALENHGGVVATAEGVLEIVRAVGCPWFGVNLDTGNFHSADPYEEMARCAPYAVTCQLKVDVTPAGGKTEEVDIAKVVGILRKASYRGYVTLEYEGAEEPLEAVPKYLAKMRKFLGD